MILYHGTPRKNLKSILKYGLSPKSFGKWVYLTDDPVEARSSALDAAWERGEDPNQIDIVVLKVQIPDTRKLIGADAEYLEDVVYEGWIDPKYLEVVR